jgi:hypothetical protein
MGISPIFFLSRALVRGNHGYTAVPLVFNSSKWPGWTSIHTGGTFYTSLQEASYGAFTLDVKSVLNKNLGGILRGNQC